MEFRRVLFRSGRRRAHGVADHVDDLLDLPGIVAFGHHADQRFGARRTDHETPAPVQRRLALGDRGDDMLVVERSEEHTSELQSLMRISYAVFCLKKKKIKYMITQKNQCICTTH